MTILALFAFTSATAKPVENEVESINDIQASYPQMKSIPILGSEIEESENALGKRSFLDFDITEDSEHSVEKRSPEPFLRRLFGRRRRNNRRNYNNNYSNRRKYNYNNNYNNGFNNNYNNNFNKYNSNYNDPYEYRSIDDYFSKQTKRFNNYNQDFGSTKHIPDWAL